MNQSVNIMQISYKRAARFEALRSSVESIIRPESRLGRSNNSAELPRTCETNRTSKSSFDETSSTENSTDNDSTDMTKSAVVAFFNDCSSSTLSPSALSCKEAKSVRFRANIDVMEVERFIDDSGTLWYSKADFLAIERENLKISWQRMNDKELADDEKQTVRGLELEVYPGAARRRQEIEDLAFESVMVEQDNQDREGIYDPYAIAEVYQKNGARQCQLEAQTVGLKDFQNAKVDQEQIYKMEALPKRNDSIESVCGYYSDDSGNLSQ